MRNFGVSARPRRAQNGGGEASRLAAACRPCVGADDFIGPGRFAVAVGLRFAPAFALVVGRGLDPAAREALYSPQTGYAASLLGRRARTPALQCKANGRLSRRRVASQGPTYGVTQTRLPPAAGPVRSLPPGNSDLRRRVGVQSGRPDEIVPGEKRKDYYYRVRSENGCRSRAATSNPPRGFSRGPQSP